DRNPPATRELSHHVRRVCISLLAATALAAAVPSAASARSIVVATGTRYATLVDVSTNAVTGRIDTRGKTRAVVVSPDGTRAYVASGRRVLIVDITGGHVAGGVRLDATVVSLALSG